MSELSGIQLHFGHGVKSPLYETQWAKQDQVKEAWVDTSRTIKWVSMLVTAYGTLSQLRLVDDQKKVIVDLVWKCTVTATNSEDSEGDMD